MDPTISRPGRIDLSHGDASTDAGETDEMSMILMLTTARLSRVVDAYLKRETYALGLDRSEASVLVALMNTDDDQPLSPTRLRHLLVQTSPGMTATLGRLERKGLVGRVQDPDDGRSRLVLLTDTGRDTGTQLLTHLVAGFSRMFGNRTEEDRRELLGSMHQILGVLESATGQADSTALGALPTPAA